jgi:hypothetical protein
VTHACFAGFFVFKTMEEKENQNLNNLKEKAENLRHKAFMQMIYIAFIFAVPAAIAFFVGNYFDNIHESGRQFKLIALPIAFVLSWIITIFQYRRIDKEFKEVEQKMIEEKEK